MKIIILLPSCKLYSQAFNIIRKICVVVLETPSEKNGKRFGNVF